MALVITPLYAALLTLIYLGLSARVVRQRFRVHASLGDGGDKTLIKYIRVHGNFAEYVPLGLLLMLMAELQAAPAIALHLMGIALLLGRLCHAIGVSSTSQVIVLRQLGVGLTFSMLGLSAIGLIGHAIL